MKEYTFLALKSEEFLDMIENIAKERMHLNVKKRTDDSITLTYQLVLPLLLIKFMVQSKEDSITVKRSLNWIPVIMITLPLLAILELIVFGISLAVNKANILLYVLVSMTWAILVIFLLYHIFGEIDALISSLYRVKV